MTSEPEKKVKKKWYLLIIVFVFVIAFFSSTDIILRLTKNRFHSIEEIEVPNLTPADTNVFYKFENFRENNDIFNSVEFYGWIFTSEPPTDEESQVKLLLISDNKGYELSTSKVDRIDLKKTLRTYNIIDVNQGFISYITPVTISPGNYKLWIKLIKGQQEYLVETEFMFEKQNRDFIQIIP